MLQRAASALRNSLFLPALITLHATAAWGYPGYLPGIETPEHWDSIALNSNGIKFIIPGANPGVVDENGKPVPGHPDLSCFDFTIYGPPVQHIDILHATRLDCIADFDAVDMSRMRLAMTQFAGYVIRVRLPETGEIVNAVEISNDQFAGPPVLTPELANYIFDQIRATFNEAELGRLVYYPFVPRARERAKAWLEDPSSNLSFEVVFEVQDVPPFVRGDVDGDGAVDISDAVAILNYLFVDSTIPIVCLDAADADDNGRIELHDPVMILRALFTGGPDPASPFPDYGQDRKADDMYCKPLS